MGEEVMGGGGDVVRLFFKVPHSDLTHDQQVNKRERETTEQNKCYLTQNRGERLADYLNSVKNLSERKILTVHRLSDHRLDKER